MIIENIPTFKYFSNFIDNWNNLILDFGSNSGNLIRSSNNFISQTNYIGIDVDAEAIYEGQKEFGNATWIHYNRYNPVYNPDGNDLLPILDIKVELIISYSVFTHMTIEDTLDVIDYLTSTVLKSSGKMYFTYCNIENGKCVEWFRNRRRDCDIIPVEDIIYLADNKISKDYPLKCKHFVSFYKESFLKEKLSKYNPVFYPAPNGWVQDCIMISK